MWQRLKIRRRPGSARSGTEEAALRALLAHGRTARPGQEQQRSGGVGYRPPAATFPHPQPASWHPRPSPPTDPSLPLTHIRMRKPTSRHERPPARPPPSRRATHPRPAVGEGSGGQSLTLKMAPAPPPLFSSPRLALGLVVAPRRAQAQDYISQNALGGGRVGRRPAGGERAVSVVGGIRAALGGKRLLSEVRPEPRREGRGGAPGRLLCAGGVTWGCLCAPRSFPLGENSQSQPGSVAFRYSQPWLHCPKMGKFVLISKHLVFISRKRKKENKKVSCCKHRTKLLNAKIIASVLQ